MELAKKFSSWLETTFPEEPIAQWLFAIPAFFVAYALIVLIFKGIKRVVEKKSENKPWLEFVRVFLGTHHTPFFIAFSIYVSMLVSPISYDHKIWFNRAFGVGVILQIGLWTNITLKWLFRDVLSREADASKTTVLRALSVASRSILWIGIFLLILDNFGVNVTTLVAGLGIGGIAIALGVQKIAEDIFASLSIVMDRPFVIGDFIVVDDLKGNVEDIGIKTTRIRSLSGERIIFSNSNLLSSRIRNYTQSNARRIATEFSVTYETPLEKMKLATKLIEEAVKKAENTHFEFAHFTKFMDSSLNIETAYWIKDLTNNQIFSTQERVNLNILESFNKNGIDFAYPTQRQYFDSETLKMLSGNGLSQS